MEVHNHKSGLDFKVIPGHGWNIREKKQLHDNYLPFLNFINPVLAVFICIICTSVQICTWGANLLLGVFLVI